MLAFAGRSLWVSGQEGSEGLDAHLSWCGAVDLGSSGGLLQLPCSHPPPLRSDGASTAPRAEQSPFGLSAGGLVFHPKRIS